MLSRMIFPALIATTYDAEVENSQSIKVLVTILTKSHDSGLHELGGAKLTYCLFCLYTFNNCTMTLCIRTGQIKLKIIEKIPEYGSLFLVVYTQD